MEETAKTAFAANEEVLCFHGPLVYEAKILKAEIWDGSAGGGTGPHYFVHYKGWNSKWDEWVAESRVLKWTEKNLARQAHLKDTFTETKRAASSKDRGALDTGANKSKKRPRDQSSEKDDQLSKRVDVKIPIPDALKVRLVDDWEYVTKNHLLVPLPRAPNIVDILKMFADHVKDNSTFSGSSDTDAVPDDILNEVLDGLKLYFHKALGNILLYRFERHQYMSARKEYEGKTMPEIYGAEHLLRLFGHTNMDADAIKVLQSVFDEILKFMEKNAESLFVAYYEAASPAYVSLSRNS
ncbi:MAG: MRG-domain-containing protein [Olpidium bornovanus]|uniref:Chromatin modification-related protein EAF3 n=1 Tax=Olpidium bornovanus TaxID=278681 RepID=A0A8H7ZT83_9FUNG|nr:MAG: MRG-domain-containing protein [Olpidium bornovanus]